MSQKVFKETQRFRQIWLWLLMLGLFGFLLWDQVYWFYSWIFSKNTIEKFPGGWIDIITTITALGLISLLFFSRLETFIDKSGIKVTFWPLRINRQFIKWDDIKEIYIRKYNALDDYGGWGVKHGQKGKAYNVSGNKGLQLNLNSGEKLLIGTQK